MPEGHIIHRYASRHRALLVGREVIATSPQGRFRGGAARLSGRELLGVETHGKHLFYRWHRAETLHIHLGLYGKFRTFESKPPAPTPATRLSLATDEVTIYLAGPTVCELIIPSQEEAIRARLGPDPLQVGTDGNHVADFAARLERRRIPIGAAILDQNIIAGIGNIYRAEVLFLVGLDPATPANEVTPGKVEEIWDTTVELLQRGVDEGMISTVSRRSMTGGEESDRLYVYKRDRSPCRICGELISSGEMANRSIWWCPSCQAGVKRK